MHDATLALQCLQRVALGGSKLSGFESLLTILPSGFLKAILLEPRCVVPPR